MAQTYAAGRYGQGRGQIGAQSHPQHNADASLALRSTGFGIGLSNPAQFRIVFWVREKGDISGSGACPYPTPFPTWIRKSGSTWTCASNVAHAGPHKPHGLVRWHRCIAMRGVSLVWAVPWIYMETEGSKANMELLVLWLSLNVSQSRARIVCD